MLHSQETGVTQSGQLLHSFFQRLDYLVLLELLILINHLLIEHKHCHFLEGLKPNSSEHIFIFNKRHSNFENSTSTVDFLSIELKLQ